MAFRKTEVKCEILEDYATLSSTDNSELKLTYTSWNKKEPKYDLRNWYTNGYNKGTTFTGEEMESLYNLLDTMYSGKKTKHKTIKVKEIIKSSNKVDFKCDDDYVNNIVNKLDKIFSKHIDSIEKKYEEMEFCPQLGKRLQYYIKSDKITEKSVKEVSNLALEYISKGIEIWSFKTDRGLYITTLRKGV